MRRHGAFVTIVPCAGAQRVLRPFFCLSGAFFGKRFPFIMAFLAFHRGFSPTPEAQKISPKTHTRAVFAFLTRPSGLWGPACGAFGKASRSELRRGTLSGVGLSRLKGCFVFKPDKYLYVASTRSGLYKFCCGPCFGGRPTVCC